MSELYCDRLSKEPAVWRDLREGVKEDVRAEGGGVRDLKCNRVSPDRNALNKEMFRRTLLNCKQCRRT